MKKIVIQLGFCLFSVFTIACSSSRTCTDEQNYHIEYFSGGGFTGMERGIIIDCSGWKKNWERKINSSINVLDSLQLNSETMDRLDELMKDSEIFSYKMKNISNYTTTLILTKQDKVNKVSYNSSEEPANLPKSIKAILSEIEKVNK